MQANRLNFCFSFGINDIQTEGPQASSYLSSLNPANNADTPRQGQVLLTHDGYSSHSRPGISRLLSSISFQNSRGKHLVH